jgi:hypothetical protein
MPKRKAPLPEYAERRDALKRAGMLAGTAHQNAWTEKGFTPMKTSVPSMVPGPECFLYAAKH